MSSVKNITLESGDGQSFEVDEAVATEFHFKQLIKDDCTDNRILLPEVTSQTLAKVIEYCNKHVESAKPADEELKAWDAEFVNVDQTKLFDVMLAANYLKMKGLMGLIAEAVAGMIKGKTVDQIRETFNVTSKRPPRDIELERKLRRKFEDAKELRDLSGRLSGRGLLKLGCSSARVFLMMVAAPP